MPSETKTKGEELLEEILRSAPPPESDTEEEVDLDKLKQRTPPSRGICRRCGENKPINRLMLCYPCWVKTNLEERGWREGMPHPDWCQCQGLNAHGDRRSCGN